MRPIQSRRLFLFAMLCLSQAALADLIQTGQPQPPAVQSSLINAPGNGTVREIQPNRSGNTLRCWQNGRLLYEANGIRHGGERNGDTQISLQGADGAVTVFDLKQGLCILSQR